MARPKKENTPITLRMEQTLYERLNDYCEKSGQSRTLAVERAVKMYIDDYDEKMQKLESEK